MKGELKDYRILVTGAAGVLGLDLSRALLEQGAQVVGLDLKGNGARFRKAVRGYAHAEFFSGNLLEPKSIEKALDVLQKGHKKTLAVYHLAGQGDANKCDTHPKEAFELNITATGDLMEACARKGVRRVIFPSTAYVYGTSYDTLITEKFPVKPAGIYPLTKLTAEVIIQGYTEFAGMHCDIVRISNIYGPKSRPETILGTILSQAERNKEIFLHCLWPVRDFIYVEDVIEALVRLLKVRDAAGCRIFNLSTGEETSVGQLAELFCKVKGLPKAAVRCEEQASDKISQLVLSNQAISTYLRWKPKYDLKAGLRKTLEIRLGGEKSVNVKSGR